MTDIERREIVIQRLLEVSGKKFTDGLVVTLMDAIEGYHPSRLEAALKIYITHCRYFDYPHFIELVESIPNPSLDRRPDDEILQQQYERHCFLEFLWDVHMTEEQWQTYLSDAVRDDDAEVYLDLMEANFRELQKYCWSQYRKANA